MKKKLCLLLMLILIIASIIIGSFSISRNFEVLLNSELENQCTYIINDAVLQATEKNGELAEMLVIEKNQQGVISYMYVNSTTLNKLSLDAMAQLESEIKGLANVKLEVPLGNLMFSRLFAGKGPRLKMQAFPVGEISIDYTSKLAASGINQVLFHMDMTVAVKMETIFGIKHYSTEIKRIVPVCDIIIVGNVPDTFANLPSETEFLNLLP